MALSGGRNAGYDVRVVLTATLIDAQCCQQHV